jgi:hypothetical protein
MLCIISYIDLYITFCFDFYYLTFSEVARFSNGGKLILVADNL